MKRTICTLLLMLVAATAVDANAQSMKLDSQGIRFGSGAAVSTPDTRTIAVSPIITYRARCLGLGRNVKSSIPTFELGWNVPSATGYSAYEGMPYGEFFDIREWKSTQVTVNLFQVSAFNRMRNLGIAMAIGIRANNYRLSNSTSLTEVDRLVVPFEIEGRVKKSKFTTAAIHIPVEVSLGNPAKFALSVGGFVDMVMNSHTKIKYKGGSKDKEHNFPVNFIQAGVTARLSFFNFSIYGNYTPTQLFKTGRGPELRTWTIGIGF